MPDHDDISIAQWSLVDEIRQGLWTTLDFPRLAREEFDINGIEFVNTLFEVPHMDYLNQLKQRADEFGVTMVLIMVDAEGDPCSAELKSRKQYGINHRKWIDIAHYLGCHGIRTNCRGVEGATPEENLKWAADSYWMLLDYASEAGINVVIENHGGVSNDPDWMERLFAEVDHPLFGSYPDWRQPGPDFDNLAYLEKMVPFAKGMSYRNQPTEELTGRMIRLSRKLGYTGWYGIESTGRDAIREGKEMLVKYLGL
jgi:sugar phosphate isomerase/epimerase